MSETNRSYRIHTDIKNDKYLNVNLTQDIDELNILSLKISTENVYRLHTSKYGCLVGRVLANGGVGIPNVKLSVFIAVDNDDINDPVLSYLYPYNNVKNKNYDGIRYNLLPDTINDKCHQDIGTFPNKRLVLDDNNVLEIFDKYYKFTTTTNASGDYMIFGLPTGNNIIHSELDLSDIGILSQKPRDLFYKGYNHTQFENSSQFKKDTNLDNLTQVISQDNSVYVYPFWGDDDVTVEGAESQIKITRNDIDVSYKFEPTCIFIGSIISDEKSQGFSKRCVPTTRMGKMDRLTTGKGTIEMIRKTPSGDVESFAIQGNDLIDGNGTWCYQIPMNLDYVKTDEYGNLVAAEDETVGIPTRASVRFRISLADYESDSANAHLVKILVPNNPGQDSGYEPDYNFGSATSDDNFRDLLWNNVYTVKEYIPRIQRIRESSSSSARVDRNKNFSGIKVVNVNGSNNPMPYNNIRVQLTFLFIFQCILFKSLVLIVKILNAIIYVIMLLSCNSQNRSKNTSKCGTKNKTATEDMNAQSDDEAKDNKSCKAANRLRYIVLDGAMCPETDGLYMAFGAKKTTGNGKKAKRKTLVGNTIKWAGIEGDYEDSSTQKTESNIDRVNGDGDADEDWVKVTTNSPDLVTDGPDVSDSKSADHKYQPDRTEKDSEKPIWGLKRKDGTFSNVSASDEFFIKCVELQFAMEYEVIQFDFYNDWINGCIYIPRWFAELRKRRKGTKIIACDNKFSNSTPMSSIKMVQQCSLKYKISGTTLELYSDGGNDNYKESCGDLKGKCHKGKGRQTWPILNNGGIVKYVQNMNEKFLYYLLPNEYILPNEHSSLRKTVNLFATDVVLLGNTSDCNIYGIPTANGYPSSTFIMPPPTIQVVDESQENELGFERDSNYEDSEGHKFVKIKSVAQSGQETEMAGIDWGYNPIKPIISTDKIGGQRSGHFLEIGCVNSMVNTKSCVNLQRICELGAEMSQSHYNVNGNIKIGRASCRERV